jgi:transcription termination factor Rho
VHPKVKSNNKVQRERKVVSGVLEILPKGFGFLRSAKNQYRPSDEDIYVPAEMIRRFQIQSGTLVEGREGHGRGKSLLLREIISLDQTSPEDYRNRTPFQKLTSIDPFERFRLDESNEMILRVIDLLAPVGKGQRGLIVAAPRTGKTMILQSLAKAIIRLHRDVELVVLLIDERPEEVTDFRRSTRAQVIASSSDHKTSHHIQVTEMVLERARRLVESGKDVVILLDSITRMARAYNSEESSHGRTLSGGLGVGTLAQPREFFGAARKAEEGGSLTIIATAIVDTGSRMDDVIFEEFKGTGNMELVLSRKLADRRIWPAIDLHASGTRKEEKLRDNNTQAKVNVLRRALADLPGEEAMQTLLQRLEKTSSNEAFLGLIRS